MAFSADLVKGLKPPHLSEIKLIQAAWERIGEKKGQNFVCVCERERSVPNRP